MPDLRDGESTEMQGSGSKPYVLKNTGGVYSCSCPAWRNQSLAIDKRTCKHLLKLRGAAAEEARVGGAAPVRSRPATDTGEEKAPSVLLAERWDGVTDLSGWWLSEKLDGVRAYWDGERFLSRNGNVYHAPEWFTAGLPNAPLDGELWLGRKQFQRAVSIARRQDKSDHWRELRYLVFDAPLQHGGFEERIQFLKDLFARKKLDFASPHAHELCRSLDHLRAELAHIEALGGEGLMLREPGSSYVAGRSTTLLKVKSFQDAEATVIGHQAGAGRHKGRLGALLVVLPNGTRFSVGTGFSDAQREKPPPVGSTITFRFQELTDGGVPRFPSYIGTRVDVPAAASPPSPKGDRSMSSTSTPRRFEFTDGSSDKFWEIAVNGKAVTVCYGRRGTSGQTTTKEFPDGAAAEKHAETIVKQKLAKGYKPVS